MKVGITIDTVLGLLSLRRITRSLYESLAARHELVFLPREYPMMSPAEQDRMAEEFILGCDAVVAVFDARRLLAARRRLGSGVPFVFMLYGELPNGAWDAREHVPDLTSRDVMVVNCESEAEIARLLFCNASVRVVPFALEAGSFYPLDEEERRAARERLRFRDGDRIILYVGRIMPEKGVHRLLAVFDAVCRRVPDAHLVLVGNVGGETMLERFGVAPVWLPNTYSKLIARLEHPERVHTVVAPDEQRLRELYNVADVKANLTLNPDENFGMAQVEAMACGTPVVGTAWGGLKDTIVDAVTGYKVSTVPTPTGVKVSWWEAVNRIVAVLEDRPGRERFRETCTREAGRYSRAALEDALEAILRDSVREREQPAEPLRATAFAEEFWTACDPRWPGAAYRRTPRAEELHRELVTPFTAVTPEHVPAGEALEPGHVLSLATPVHPGAGARVRLDDVFYALEVQVPGAHQYAVHALLALLREQPAIPAGELAAAVPMPGVDEALAWMLERGLLLRTRPRPEWIDPAEVGRGVAEPMFSAQRIDRSATDLIIYQ